MSFKNLKDSIFGWFYQFGQWITIIFHPKCWSCHYRDENWCSLTKGFEYKCKDYLRGWGDPL